MATDLAKVAKEKGIKYFLISFVDLFGSLRSKLVPARAIRGMQKDGAGFAGFAAWFLLLQTGIFSSAFSMEFSDLRTSSPFTQEQFQDAVLRDWVLLRSSKAHKLTFIDKELHLSADTIAVAGTTSEVIFVAVISGRITSEDMVAEAGDVLSLGYIQAAGIRVRPFDAQDFSERLRRLGSEELAERLHPVIAAQKRKMFWGLLRPSQINVNKPFNILFEEGRRKYLLHPTLLHIKSSSKSLKELAVNTANAFITALHTGDVESVAALLSPMIFLEEGRTPYSNDDWLKRRLYFAEALCRKTQAKEISQVRSEDSISVFYFALAEQQYLLKLQVFDNSYFVRQITQKDS